MTRNPSSMTRNPSDPGKPSPTHPHPAVGKPPANPAPRPHGFTGTTVSSPVRQQDRVPPLTATGERVRVAPVHRRDLDTYPRALADSAARIRHWNPIDPGDLGKHLRFQSTGYRTFVIHALDPDPEAGHDLVGVVNVTSVVRGRAMSGTLGYNAYTPYAGAGLFAEGMRLVLDLVFTPEPHGMGLHRVEAAVQPGNVRSAGLLRSLGFRRRAYWPNYLWLADDSGLSTWRDHITYGLTAENWPAQPWALPEQPRPVVVIGPHWGYAGERLAAELSVPYISAGVMTALGWDSDTGAAQHPLPPTPAPRPREQSREEGHGQSKESPLAPLFSGPSPIGGVRRRCPHPLVELLAGSVGAVLQLPVPVSAEAVEHLLGLVRRAGIDLTHEFTIAGDTPPEGLRGVVSLALDVLRSAHGG